MVDGIPTWLVLVAAVGIAIGGCAERHSAAVGGQLKADATAPIDAAVLSDSVDALNGPDASTETASSDAAVDATAADGAAVPDTADVFDPAAVPMDVTWVAAAGPSVCLPNAGTVITQGPVHSFFGTCTPQACAACGPADKCTCAGDGGTPCAWTPIAPLPFPLQSALSVWGDGKLYIWGGRVGGSYKPNLNPLTDFGIVQTVQVWDPIGNKWSVTPHAPVYNGDDRPGIAYGDGHLYVMGTNVPAIKGGTDAFVELPWGPDYADIAAYDPATKQWTALPKAGSPGACGGFGRMVFLNGRLIVPGCEFWYLISAYKTGPGATYDSSTKLWTPLPPQPGSSHTPWQPEAVSGTEVAGFTTANDMTGDLATFLILDTSTWTWVVHPIPAPCTIGPGSGAGTGVLAGFEDGFLYSVQLENSQKGSYVFVWWRASQSWESVPVPTWLQTFVQRPAVWDGSKFVMWKGDGATYDPYTRVWRQMARMDAPSFRADGIDTVRGNRYLTIGGFDVATQFAAADGAGLLVPDIVLK